MDNLLKFFGLDRRKGQPETALEPADYSKKLDEWLKENIPRREEKISLRKKAWDLTVLSLFVVGTLYFYKKDIHKFPKKRDQRKYKFFTGSVIAGKHCKYELRHDKTTKISVRQSKTQVSLRHQPSLIRVFAVCMK